MTDLLTLTPTGLTIYANPDSESEWESWKQRVWNAVTIRCGAHPGLVPLEQYMLRSHKEKRCIECGEPGTVQQRSALILSVAGYYFCADCAYFWEHKDD